MDYPIYLDYNATTPCHQEVLEAMLPWFLQNFGNAASKSHAYGWVAEDAVERAREQVAKLIGAKTKEIIFTSGATESLNLAIRGTFEHYSNEKQHYITCKTEHKAVLDNFQKLESLGAEITYLDVDSQGSIDLDELKRQIKPDTKMICLMWANNETGHLHPVSEIANIAEEAGVVFCTDAVQAAGKIPVYTEGIHLMAISAHKIYGPKGVGALYIRHNQALPKPLPIILGGGHEKGFRSGTLNVPGIVGFGKAAEIRLREMAKEGERLRLLRDKLEIELLRIPGTHLNGSRDNRLPHVSNIAFEGVEGEDLLKQLNRKIAVSSGSACTSISPKPSHVLSAMGVPADLGRSSVRFSLGTNTSDAEVQHALDWVRHVVMGNFSTGSE